MRTGSPRSQARCGLEVRAPRQDADWSVRAPRQDADWKSALPDKMRTGSPRSQLHQAIKQTSTVNCPIELSKGTTNVG